jgi:hypothetical protein
LNDEDLIRAGFDPRMPQLGLKNKSKSYITGLRLDHLLRGNSVDSKLDFAFLYSDPLLIEIDNQDKESKKWKKELVEFNEPLETELEFDGIVLALKKTKRQFTVRREIATYDNLKSVMACHPKVIHISCHGDCFFD